MCIIIINRFSENTINYEEALSGIDGEYILITREKHKNAFRELFPNRKIINHFHEDDNIRLYIQELHKKKPVTSIVATHEFDLEEVGKIRDLLNIPGQTEDSAQGFRNKVLMKNMVKEAVRTPKYLEIKEQMDLISFKEINGFPFIIKPVDGAGSAGFSVISNESEFKKILEEYTDFPYIAEEFIEGDMYHVDGLYINNQLIISQPSIYINGCLAYREEKYLGSVMLSETHPLFERLNKSVLKVLRNLPTPNHVIPFHAEFFYTSQDEIVFCEIASRVGGGKINNTFLQKTGVNLLSECVRAQCDKDYNHKNLKIQNDSETYGWMLIPPKKGTLLSINTDFPFDWIIHCIVRDEKIGKTFSGGDTSVSAIMSLIIKGKDEHQVQERFNIINEWLENNIIWDIKTLTI
ncbi:ATP-grasp domain-containing protein [Bacillus paranthracis]|uniref:ATP-grasp domain-containing protein n=1 Tax=Bacillus paranthracis TaxID=2026186 RepID=UPI002259EC29|nr:ATP-grasp domain-containing protein [Bacillus paranthracis]